MFMYTENQSPINAFKITMYDTKHTQQIQQHIFRNPIFSNVSKKHIKTQSEWSSFYVDLDGINYILNILYIFVYSVYVEGHTA